MHPGNRPEILSARRASLRKVKFLIALLPIVVGSGCGVTLEGPPAGAYMGRPRIYDYSPSVIQTGDVQQFWWCGGGNNPNKPSQVSDTILYATVNTRTKETSIPFSVLGETPGSWDSVYACNPKVVEGVFDNPLGDGQTYTYAMYYVGTAAAGIINNIGVAFSNDGVRWKKYPKPVILADTQTNYGVAQPVPYNSDHKSAIWLFYEDANGQQPNPHIETTSTDGIHFTVVGKLTTKGMALQYGWGDMAYDSVEGYWYAVFNNVPYRSTSSTGGVPEYGGEGVTLYRIQSSSLLTGATPWQQLKTFDTISLGKEDAFIAGLLRDSYGNVNVGAYPAIQVFPSISNPAPAWNASPTEAAQSAAIFEWDIGEAEWNPGSPLLALNLYANSSTEELTTGWIDPEGGFVLKSTIGHLYESPQQGASLAFYGCKDGSSDYFISTDNTCGGKFLIGLEGYGYFQAQASPSMKPLYSCYSDREHYFASQEVECNNQGRGTLLGFILP
jgi:hypothetical protein